MNFSETRGLLYEICGLAKGGRICLSDPPAGGYGPYYDEIYHAMFTVIERNAESIIKLLDKIEDLPGALP